MSHPSRIWIGVAAVVALAVLACLVGVFTTGLRLAVAGLSPGHGLFVVPIWHSILTGLILIGIGCATLVVSCAAAYLAAWRRWDFHGHDWQDIVEKGGVRKAWDSLHARTPEGEQRRAARDARFRHVSARGKARRERRLAKVSRAAKLTMVADARERAANDFQAAADVQGKAAEEHTRAVGEAADQGHVMGIPAGARLLQILAGFNLLVLAGVIALGIGQAVAAFQSAWWAVIPASVIAFLLGPPRADDARAARRASAGPRRIVGARRRAARCCHRPRSGCWSSPASSSRPGAANSFAPTPRNRSRSAFDRRCRG